MLAFSDDSQHPKESTNALVYGFVLTFQMEKLVAGEDVHAQGFLNPAKVAVPDAQQSARGLMVGKFYCSTPALKWRGHSSIANALSKNPPTSHGLKGQSRLPQHSRN